MRMMLKAVFDTEAASEVMSSGQGAEANRRVVDRFQPEAFYAFTDDGQRAILMVFDMADTSQIPAYRAHVSTREGQGHADPVHEP
jgi:hypothetical protein